MIKKHKEKLKELFSNTKFAEPLKKHCTFRIGGPADAFIEIKKFDFPSSPKPKESNLQALLKFLKTASIPHLILGGGTNVLFPDKGFKGVVIKITANKIRFKQAKTSTTLIADAGTNLQILIKKAKEKGFHNLTQLTGIPGTLGGAIRGNAGANGLEIKDVLVSAQILNPKTGKITTKTPKSLKLSYRNSTLKKTNEIVLQATLKLSKAKKYKTLVTKLNLKRIQSQPYGLSAGSFFKNPKPGDPKKSAGYLIEQCGLKGHKLGGAKISEKHANFIENFNNATQKDVLKLANFAKKEVQKKFSIKLEEEVQIIPEKI